MLTAKSSLFSCADLDYKSNRVIAITVLFPQYKNPSN